MFKLLFCIILFLNLELSQGPIVFSGEFVKLIPVQRKEQIENSPSMVEMPKQSHTQEHAMSIHYRPLLVKVSPYGAYNLPMKVEEYFAVPDQPIPRDTVSRSELLEFFCPAESSGKLNCLLPTTLHLCNVEAEPVIVPLLMELKENEEAQDFSNSAGGSQSTHLVMKICGPSGEGKMYGVVYRLCSETNSSGQLIGVSEYEVYNFCYDQKKQETIFAQYMIPTPELLFNEKLNKPKELPFQMTTKDDGYFEKPFFHLEAAYATPRTEYKPQELVLSDDIALGALKIPTNHFANVRYQHVSLIELWNKIGKLMLESSAAKHNDSHFMYVGAFELSEDNENVEFIHENNISIPDIWIKLVIVKDLYSKERGLAVLMNNVPKDSTLEWKWGGSLCPENFCDIPNRKDTFFIGLTDVGHNVRCCKVTKKILMFFNLENEFNENDVQVFEIDNLTD